MIETIIQSTVSLANYLREYRSAFKTLPQYRHFMSYVLGLLIYLGRKNLTGLSEAVPGGKDESSLYRFVSQQAWDAEQVRQVRLEMLNRKVRRALKALAKSGQPVPVYVILDDSLVRKTGVKMVGVAKYRSHISKQAELGHLWVTAQLVVAGYSFPLEGLLYRKQTDCEAAGVPFFSKGELAEQLLEHFEPLPDTTTYVLTDSWYSSQTLLKRCEQRGFKYIGAVKPNRKFKLGNHDLKVRQWEQMLPKSHFDRVKVKRAHYKLWSALGTLSSKQAIRLVVNRRVGQKKWHYLISTDLDLSAPQVLKFYLVRWRIEDCYRVLKQNFGWGDYEMRSLKAVERHSLLVMVAYTFVELQRPDAQARTPDTKRKLTLGILQRSLQHSVQRALIRHVFELSQVGFDLETISHKFAA